MAELRLFSKNVNNANFQPAGLAIVNDSLAISPSEVSSSDALKWNTLKNAVVSIDEDLSTIEIDIPNDNSQYDDLKDFSDLMVTNMNHAGDSTAEIIFYVVGDAVDDRNFAYLIRTNGVDAYEVVKLDSKWVESGAVLGGGSSFIGDTLLKTADTAIDNVSFAMGTGTGYLEIDTLGASEAVNTVMSINIVDGATGIGQINYTPSYVGKDFRVRISNGIFSGTLSDTDGASVDIADLTSE